MEEVKVLTTLDEVKAISDPLKYRILMSLNKIGEPATVKQIADQINEVPAKVHYHVKKMEANGVLVMVRTKEIKGIVAKYYEPTAKSFEVKCDSETMKTNRQLVIAEKQRLISEMYENSKYTFFDQIAVFSNDAVDNSSGKGLFVMDEIFLDKEQEISFRKMIQEFMEKNNDCRNRKPETKKFHCFLSFFEMK